MIYLFLFLVMMGESYGGPSKSEKGRCTGNDLYVEVKVKIVDKLNK